MPNAPTKSQPAKSRTIVVFEQVLLALCLCVLALRVTYTESPSGQSGSGWGTSVDTVYSLAVSAVLIFGFIVWLVSGICSGCLVYRRTGIEAGVAAFCVAGVVGVFAASDKRAAVTDLVVLLGPVLMALLLVQVLDSRAKIKLVLAVVAALGVVTAHQCAEQFFRGNQMTLEQYEKDPQSMLEPLGIEPGSFQQFVFEHRIYSKGVRGFFTTRNSAGCFSLLAVFSAVVLLVEKLGNRRGGSSVLTILASVVAAAAILFALVLTRSKGALIGMVLAVGFFVAYLRGGKWLRSHRKGVLLGCLLVLGGAALAVALYGLKHGTLPGGGSMLVRWQYWHAAARMYAEYPVTGVGPGNFSEYYTHYKPAEALESVSDPHNFLLSVLSQYGPLGLVGFLWMLIGPLWVALAPGPGRRRGSSGLREPAFGKVVLPFAGVISAAMLLVRPLVSPLPEAVSMGERWAGVLVLYVMPVFVFLLGLLLVAAGQGPSARSRPGVVVGALLGAAVGLLVHNLIDFAIFEPGVSTTLWAVLACLVAADYDENHRAASVVSTGPARRLVSVVAAVGVVVVFLGYAFVPVARSAGKTARAREATGQQRFDEAHGLLDSASADDALSPAAAYLNGRLYLRRFEMGMNQQPELLFEAERCFLTAAKRNKAGFRSFERLTEVYVKLAETAEAGDKAQWLAKALDAGGAAVERYPGCARLRVELARVAEECGRIDLAIEQYKRAIEIEDAYRRQFKIIYPEQQDVVSRLGEGKYFFAKDRLRSLLAGRSP